jgi:ParB family transcriptional regulator, chromosome partitioning protein
MIYNEPMLGGGLESLIPKKGSAPQAAGAAPVRPPAHSVPTPTPALANKPAGMPGHAESGWPHREEFGERITAPARQQSGSWTPAPGRERGAVQSPSAYPRQKTPEVSVFQIEVEKIRPNPYQPRREFNDDELKELAESIREFGVIQPIVVTKVVKETSTGTDVEYQLIAGERRLMAAKLVGLPRVPATVRNFDSHRAKLEVALIENIQRSDLNPLESARAYTRLMEEFGLTQREVAVRVGKSREVIANATRLLNLPTPVQEALARGRVSESQARALLALPSAHEQLAALSDLLSGNVSVRALRQKLTASAAPAPNKDPEASYWERKLEEQIGAPVKISKKGEKGKLSIRFFSDAEWRSIVERLLGDRE